MPLTISAASYLLLIALGLGAPVSALAQTSDDPASPPLAVSPPAPAPTPGPSAFYSPKAVRDSRREGHATIQCKVTDEGRLTDCAVLSEDPPGYGFGEAAVKMAKVFKLKPGAKEVHDGMFKTRITFKIAP